MNKVKAGHELLGSMNMAIENLMKKVKIFAGKVKAASNIATLLFLLVMAYFISTWRKVSSFDSFINLLMAIMILMVNIKFYRIHLELRNTEELVRESEILLAYKLQKKEYSQWLIGALIMFAVVILLKLLLN